MTGLQGLLGLSGLVMSSTTWLGLLLPSELYAATWRRCTDRKSQCLHRDKHKLPLTARECQNVNAMAKQESERLLCMAVPANHNQ